MSRNSKQRRDAKRRRDGRRPTPRPSTPARGGDATAECDCPACRLAGVASTPNVHDEAEVVLVDVVRAAWRMGWQPAEVVRQIERMVTPVRPARQLIAMAIAADAEASSSGDVDRRWAAQLGPIIDRAPADPLSPGWIRRWANIVGDDVAVTTIIAVSRELASLGPLLMLIPPPGVPNEDVAKWSDLVGWKVDAGSNVDADPLLTKVRALLAKAEATDFPEEAEAFTAKAHSLMVDHAIDEAAIRGRRGHVGGADVGATRFVLNEPYAKQHMLLMSKVAGASGCRCVYQSDWAMATVVGPRNQLGRVEVLYTSLMVQSQTAFNAEAQHTSAGSRPRSRGYRSSFLTAYAIRIGQRLSEQREAATAQAVSDALPVLAADKAAVADMFDQLFGDSTRSMSFSASDRAGWAAGDDAAERARLSSDQLRTESTRRLTA